MVSFSERVSTEGRHDAMLASYFLSGEDEPGRLSAHWGRESARCAPRRLWGPPPKTESLFGGSDFADLADLEDLTDLVKARVGRVGPTCLHVLLISVTFSRRHVGWLP